MLAQLIAGNAKSEARSEKSDEANATLMARVLVLTHELKAEREG